jgi:hypothetical protein
LLGFDSKPGRDSEKTHTRIDQFKAVNEGPVVRAEGKHDDTGVICTL